MPENYILIKKTDKNYPDKLNRLENKPDLFYLKGCLPDHQKKAVAIVGARSCSSYGAQIAEKFAFELASYGIQIISGLAAGIDSFAHKGCLKAKGSTFAVLGCGIKHIYPKSNLYLYRQILENGGGIISEFEPDAPPLPYHFPIRNRIISALSDAVIVVEAKNKSGSLITASYALDQGVSVFAVPGKVTDRLSSGTNSLIWQGASVAISPEQILYELGELPPDKEKKRYQSKADALKECNTNESVNLSKSEYQILKFLSTVPVTIDDLCEKCDKSAAYLSGILLSLQFKDLVYSPYPGAYVKNSFASFSV